LAFGIASGALHAKVSGKGCVIDAAMVDITAMLGALIHLTSAAGALGRNPLAPLDRSPFHGSPFYDSYRCSDGRYITICALEPPFYALLLHKLGLADVAAADQFNAKLWPALKTRIAALIAAQPMAHWQKHLEGTDVCFAPVLTLSEAAAHPHMVARGVYAQPGPANYVQAAPAPRFFTTE
jgi:alpha-methylacyl-CoA racemase